MGSIYKHKHRGWYCCVVTPSGRRVQMYLGKVTKAGAETVRRNIERLQASNTVGIEPDPQIQAWISLCKPSFRDKMKSAGFEVESEFTSADTISRSWANASYNVTAIGTKGNSSGSDTLSVVVSKKQ